MNKLCWNNFTPEGSGMSGSFENLMNRQSQSRQDIIFAFSNRAYMYHLWFNDMSYIQVLSFVQKIFVQFPRALHF